ncbi:hypothetical protein LX69_02067 [Breznakibacter xylanolyticus]|uniref:Uncharacterized protein n=1 Tax=Breznakibacter xylanolyticus TaxID=990 RepID=A0A2W7Q245_9BACT|nr:hypothetical protein [Breznakibacter xylanolyticus]MBN2743132.1 hypothetical protein [Marinilabiliaceae bacterium]PZX15879.1 hypothetical protein LX69_02067 [Breznakibacter xylanolyticus]
MPYRRLPNTDQARLRALETARLKGKNFSPSQLPFSQKVYLELQAFLPQFQQAIDQYNFSKSKQAQIGRQLSEHFRIARLYVSHYIQVVNFCIQRNEMKPSVRKFYMLDEDEKSIPELGTEQQLIDWGIKVIKGDDARVMAGGSRIYNPSIAMVKVKYEQFIDLYNNHKNLLVTTQKMLDKVAEMRAKADQIILELWNEIEANYHDLPPKSRRLKCSECGIIYFMRRGEKEDQLVD